MMTTSIEWSRMRLVHPEDHWVRKHRGFANIIRTNLTKQEQKCGI